MSTRGITVYYRATLTTNVPVIENICTTGDGRFRFPGVLALYAFSLWCSHSFVVLEWVKEKKTREGCQQETYISRSDSISLVSMIYIWHVCR